jgi:uncharacterized protein (TIGR00369 family)
MPADAPPALDGLHEALGQVGIVSEDADAGRVVIEYRCAPHMCHSGGVAQGGFVCGWIDAAMAYAAMARLGRELAPMSLELKVSFFAPVRPGPVFAEGWVERAGRSVAFLEGTLKNAAGEVLARASSTARLIPRATVEARARAEIE